MRDWLTIELVLATLLVTSFTSVGLLASWVATARLHWFIRTALVVVFLSPLLVIPALEPFVVFALQSLVVTIGVFTYRLRMRQPRAEIGAVARAATQVRFSLITLLCLMMLAAIGSAIAIHFPRINLPGWTTIFLNGILSGFATLIGGWMFVSSRKLLVWPVGLILCLAFGGCLSAFDWFIPSVTNWTGWPPDPAMTVGTFGIGALFGLDDLSRPIWAWLLIPCLVSLVTFLILFLGNVACAPHLDPVGAYTLEARLRNRPVLQCAFLVVVMVTGALPVYVLTELLTPDPIPPNSLPVPNGYNDLVAAGKFAAASQFDSTLDTDTATKQQLAVEVAKCTKTYELIAAALKKECAAPVSYSYSAGSLPMEELTAVRSAARALRGKGKLAELTDDFAGAGDAYIQAVALGHAFRREGLLIHMLVGTACSQIGSDALYHARDKFSSEQLRNLIVALIRLVANDEPFEDIWYRDRVWSQRAYGWHGHLQQLLNDFVGPAQESGLISSQEYEPSYRVRLASMQLLIVELALAGYFREYQVWPDSLNDLIPEFISVVPVDPFDPQAGPLRYHRDATEYVLYSFGPNTTDDGGTLPASESFLGLPETGDVRLDHYFAKDTQFDGDGQDDRSTESVVDGEDR